MSKTERELAGIESTIQRFDEEIARLRGEADRKQRVRDGWERLRRQKAAQLETAVAA